jgi:maleate cis-trans isomerase
MMEPEWQTDGWGAIARLGVLTPAADVGPEAELNAMVPSAVTVHAARVPFAAMRPGGDMNPTIALQAVAAFAEPPGVDAAVELLAACPLHAIGFGFTSSAYVSGRDGEAQMCGRLRDQARGIPVVTTCSAMVDAVRSMGCQRISLVSPPWFDTRLTTLGAEYFNSAGFDVVAAASCTPAERSAGDHTRVAARVGDGTHAGHCRRHRDRGQRLSCRRHDRDPGTRPRPTCRDSEPGALVGVPVGSRILGEDRPLRAPPAMRAVLQHAQRRQAKP